MGELYDLKDMLCKELKKYSGQTLTTSSLDVIDKLAHALKNLDKVIEGESGYSNYSRSYTDGSYGNGGLFGQSGDGSYRGRDSMGRYSRSSEMARELRGMMSSAPDERTREDMRKLIERMERM